MESKKSNKKIIIGVIALVLAVGAMLIGYNLMKPKAQKGEKAVVLLVVSEDESEKTYEVQTDAEYLKDLMDELDGFTYAGTDGDYGMMVAEVNGEKASFDENGAYWSFYVNEEYCNYGIAEQPVADGDEFKIVYETE